MAKESSDDENQTGCEKEIGSESEKLKGSEPQRPQPTALADMCPIPLPNGSLGASPGRVEWLSARQLIGHGPEQQDEEDEWEQACRLQAEFDEGNWETIDSDPPTQAQSNLTFQAAKKFNGQRPGMEFKKGDQGFGYYPTRPPIISLASELAIPDMLHHPVKLELHNLFPQVTSYIAQ